MNAIIAENETPINCRALLHFTAFKTFNKSSEENLIRTSGRSSRIAEHPIA